MVREPSSATAKNIPHPLKFLLTKTHRRGKLIHVKRKVQIWTDKEIELNTGRSDGDKVLSIASSAKLSEDVGALREIGMRLRSPEVQNLAESIRANILGGPIPADEPVFLIRASDHHSTQAVKHYASIAATERGLHIEPVVTSALEHAKRMEAWPTKKSPSLPKERV